MEVWKREERTESHTPLVGLWGMEEEPEEVQTGRQEENREQKGERVSRRNKANTELNTPEQVRRKRGLRKGLEFCLQKRCG